MGKGPLFLEELRERCLAGDGALAEQLCDQGADVSQGLEILNVKLPNAVRRIHDDYADAGARLLRTNTFAANRVKLGRHNLADQAREINLAGATIAAKSAGRQNWVAGCVGPLGLTLDDEWDLDTVLDAYREQIAALLEGGVDAIQFETFTKLGELCAAARLARELGGAELPVIAEVVFGEGGFMESGDDIPQVVKALAEAKVDVIGTNCGRGVAGVFSLVTKLIPAAGPVPVAVYPNAGFPELYDGRLIYMATASYMADHAARMAKLGARLIGGCCGTTPETVRAIAMALTTAGKRPAAARPAAPDAAGGVPAAVPRKIKAGGLLADQVYQMPVITEIDPPGHLQYESVINGARLMKEAGSDAISLAENPLTSLKLSNIAVAGFIRRELGIHTICHITCRDRNLLGLQSALMGAHVMGIRGILAISGDPVQSANSASAGRSVFDINSVGLVRLLAGLNRGVTSGGQDIKGETDFSVGVAFNSAARNLKGEKLRLDHKLAEGAQFIMTQPVFDVEHARRVLELTRAEGVRVFLGFFPLVSARSALYLHNEVPGVSIPAPVLERLTSLPDKQDQEKAGLEIVCTLIEAMIPELDGVYLISPHNRPQLMAPIVKMVRATKQGSARVSPAGLRPSSS